MHRILDKCIRAKLYVIRYQNEYFCDKMCLWIPGFFFFLSQIIIRRNGSLHLKNVESIQFSAFFSTEMNSYFKLHYERKSQRLNKNTRQKLFENVVVLKKFVHLIESFPFCCCTSILVNSWTTIQNGCKILHSISEWVLWM